MRLEELIQSTENTSRKELKRILARGLISIDGQIERNGARNVDSQIHTITLNQQPLLTDERYYLLNKPKGVVSANQDQQYPTVFDCLRLEDRRADLKFVGRLDRQTEGLMLLTTNGQLAYDLLQPKQKVSKTYEVWLKEAAEYEDIARFKAGITFLDGTKCQPAELVLLDKNHLQHVQVTIHEGKYHQVKKMFLAVGKKVEELKRIAFGPLQLDESLAPGEYRTLTLKELQLLKAYFR